MIESSTYSPARDPLPESIRTEAYHQGRCSVLDVPLDFFVYFSTLPDSKYDAEIRFCFPAF